MLLTLENPETQLQTPFVGAAFVIQLVHFSPETVQFAPVAFTPSEQVQTAGKVALTQAVPCAFFWNPVSH